MIYHMIYHIWYDISCCISFSSKFKKVTNLWYLIYQMIYHMIYHIWYDISCCISFNSKFKKVTNLWYLIYQMIYHMIYHIWYDISCCISFSSKLLCRRQMMLFQRTWLHSFIPANSIAPLKSPLLLRGAPDYSTDTVLGLHAEAHRKL